MKPPATEMQQIATTWLRIVNRMDAEEKSPRNFGTGDLLHRSEIHTVMAVGRNEGINITNLSYCLGTSKSAISQMVSRLERKDYVERYHDRENDKEVRLRLTPKGTIAYLGHEQHHARIYASMHRKLGDLSPDECALIQKFLTAIEETLAEAGHGGD